jgi:hypothetical protein
MHSSDASHREREVVCGFAVVCGLAVIARSEATKQSIFLRLCGLLRFARNDGLGCLKNGSRNCAGGSALSPPQGGREQARGAAV